MWSTVFESLLCLVLLHFWIKHCLSYWKRVGVCSVKGKYLLGNMKKFWKRHISELIAESYEKLKHKDVIGGFYCFLRPILLIMDPQVIGYVLGKDSHHFTSRGLYHNEQDDPMSKNLLTAEGQQWQELRNKITPTFAADKLKPMFDTLLQVGTEFEQHFERLTTTKGKPIDVTELCSQFTMDSVASCAFGVQSNSFKEPQHNKFRKMGCKLAEQSVAQRLKLFFVESSKELSRAFGVRVIEPKLSGFFEQIIREKVRERRDNKRSDMINTLLEISSDTGPGAADADDKEQWCVVGKLTIQEICAQEMLFFTGHGYEAAATAMSWCLYELAKAGGGAAAAAVQDKLIGEVKSVLEKHQHRITYEAIQEMTYLDQVVLETLRLHPVVHSIRRVASSDYHIPDSTHIITKGSRIVVPVHAIHHDAKYYPQPEAFNPDRFAEAEMAKRPKHTFLAFGGGEQNPRDCIGMRFAMLQIKLALVLLLRQYRFGVSDKTKEPIKINPKSLLAVPKKKKIWVDLRGGGAKAE